MVRFSSLFSRAFDERIRTGITVPLPVSRCCFRTGDSASLQVETGQMNTAKCWISRTKHNVAGLEFLMRAGLLPLDIGVVFHRDERWVEKDQVMAFTAEVEGHRVFCTIAEEVLKVHFGSERHGRFQAYRENRTQIEEVAARRLEAGKDTLRLDMRDFEDSADFIPWER